VAVVIWRSTNSLVVSVALPPVLIMIGSMLATDGRLLGLSRLNNGRGEIRYSGKLTFARGLQYVTVNLTKLSMSRGIGVASLGYWNRAEVLTLIPFHQIQTALIGVAYPEFRHDIADSVRAKTVWTDMLILVAWIALILSAGMAVLLPPLVPIVFGDQWEVSASLTGPLAVIGGLQVISFMLASAIEALGRFRWVWSTDVILIAIQVVASALIFVYQNIFIAVAALLLTNVIRHAWQIWLAGTYGYLDVARLLVQYLGALTFATFLAIALWSVLQLGMAATSYPVCWILVCLLAGMTSTIVFRIRERLPVVLLARKYGFQRRR